MEKKCNCKEPYDAEYFEGGYPYCPVHDKSVSLPVKDVGLAENEYPDLSAATPEMKAEAINGLVLVTAREVMKMFYAFGLKTHIECTVINDPTKEEFDFIFRKKQYLKDAPDLEEQANGIYQKYCTDKGIVYHLMDAANFCLGYMAAKNNR